LAVLAFDPSTARRQFKRHYGMTFQAYHRARRMGLALSQVRQGGRVEEARNGSGFESESGFREAFTKIFGEPPTNAKARAPLLAERIDTPLGAMIAAADDEGLRSIPVGETRSYSWMAKRLGDENARRAVGRANGTNMICIMIPCHRVIRADGTLCGYGGGLWRKKWLLDHERRWTEK